MTRLALIAAALALATPAAAQIVPGPNIAPNGVPYTFSPRFGYLGPPAGFMLWPPPPRPRYYQPGSMPTIVVPRGEGYGPPAGSAPTPLPPPPVSRLPARPQKPPALVPRPRPSPPCPDGCPRLDPTGQEI